MYPHLRDPADLPYPCATREGSPELLRSAIPLPIRVQSSLLSLVAAPRPRRETTRAFPARDDLGILPGRRRRIPLELPGAWPKECGARENRGASSRDKAGAAVPRGDLDTPPVKLLAVALQASQTQADSVRSSGCGSS